MQESRNSPACRFVAVGAGGAEQFAMRVTIAVTTLAIEHRLLGRSRNGQPEKALEIVGHFLSHALLPLPPGKGLRADLQKHRVVHPGRTSRAGMLDMAVAAVLGGCMKCGRGLAEIGRRSSVAADAGDRLDPARRRMTALAFAIEKGVFRR